MARRPDFGMRCELADDSVNGRGAGEGVAADDEHGHLHGEGDQIPITCSEPLRGLEGRVADGHAGGATTKTATIARAKASGNQRSNHSESWSPRRARANWVTSVAWLMTVGGGYRQSIGEPEPGKGSRRGFGEPAVLAAHSPLTQTFARGCGRSLWSRLGVDPLADARGCIDAREALADSSLWSQLGDRCARSLTFAVLLGAGGGVRRSHSARTLPFVSGNRNADIAIVA